MSAEKLYQIRARSHLLQLLGEQLIGDDRLAVFELVKNGYDADATSVAITVNVKSGRNQSIAVQDTGSGMTLEDITGKWLELATDSRRKDRSTRSNRFRRLALGEKGVGRIASFKLGRYVSLVTRAAGGPEYEVSIDWDALLDQGEYLEDLSVKVRTNETPTLFTSNKTGTRIEISGLRRTDWTRGDLRSLYRMVSSLASPFQTPDQFAVEFSAPGREADVADLISPDDFLEHAVWKFRFNLSGNKFDWDYTFNPPHWKGVKSRTLNVNGDRLPLIARADQDGLKARRQDSDEALFLREEDLRGIGPIEGRIYAYYRQSEVLNATGNSSQVRSWLDDQTGVRVYRDGVRVFTYGERNDDWLGLNIRRINTPSGKLGTSSVVAAVDLDLDESYEGLKEKTNREGFDQNETFERLQRIVLSAFEHMERLHAGDRKLLDDVIRGTSKEKPIRFVEAIEHLKLGIKANKLDKSFVRDVEAIEREFTDLRDVMTHAGMAGLNLAVVFHEVEREVDALAAAVDRGIDDKTIREQIDHLHQLLQGFAPLLKKNPRRLQLASDIVRVAMRTRQSRFKYHNVVFSAPLLQAEEPDFKIRGPSNLLSGALGNLVENALYWTRFRKERDERVEPAAVFVTSSWDEALKSGFIAVVDNGTGFAIENERAKEAFFTTRSGGMGLGLYFANLVMEQCGGQLTIHSADELRDEIEIPAPYDGAAVVMRFRETK